MMSNDKFVNNKVVELIELYNFDMKLFLIQLHMIKLCIYTCFLKINCYLRISGKKKLHIVYDCFRFPNTSLPYSFPFIGKKYRYPFLYQKIIHPILSVSEIRPDNGNYPNHFHPYLESRYQQPCGWQRPQARSILAFLKKNNKKNGKINDLTQKWQK